MLPAKSRLHASREFSIVTRRGRRAGSPTVVTYVHTEASVPSTPRMGLVVSKAVGGSVIRHRVSRRLRHVMRTRLDALPAGSTVVLRALPAAAAASSSRLATDIDGCLTRTGLSKG